MAVSETEANSNEADLKKVHGIAAMSLLEAIILTLQAKGLLSTDEVDEAFEAAIAAHKHRHEDHSDAENDKAALILDKIRVEGNSVRLDL